MRKNLLRALLVAFVTAASLCFWGFYWEPSGLRVARYVLTLPNWPKPLKDMKVAVLADIHVGSPYIDLDKLETIVALTNDAKPDLILIPGDLVITGVKGGTFISPETFAPILGKLRAPLGVWAVLGNHDWWYDAAETRAALEKVGIPVIDDRAVPLNYHGTSLWLAGISDATDGPHDVVSALKDIPADVPTLAMTHNPDIFSQIPARVNLTIAGHTHGGQVWVPFLGRPVIPSKYGQRYAIGHIIENQHHLFVSSGIGTSIIPVRFMTPPEITLLYLD